MKNSPHSRDHQKHKAINEANKKNIESSPKEELINPDFKKQFIAKETHLPHKESHQHKQLCKRCAPGDVDYETEPSHVHSENERWNQTIKVQNKEKQVLFDKKQAKHKK